jgi:hypothetical protein
MVRQVARKEHNMHNEKELRADISQNAKVLPSPHVKQIVIREYHGRISAHIVTNDGETLYLCDFSPDDVQAVVNHAQRNIAAMDALRNARNNKIAAVQAVRVLTDCGIKTAKDIVDALMQ